MARVKLGAIIGLTVVLFSLTEESILAQRLDKAAACREIVLVPYPWGGAYPEARNCGTAFTAADHYIALFVEVYVDRLTEVEVALLDPEKNRVWSRRDRFDVPAGRYGSFWVWGFLPILADPAQLARQGPLFAGRVISAPGKPFRERPGEWTLSVSISGREPSTSRFTLSQP